MILEPTRRCAVGVPFGIIAIISTFTAQIANFFGNYTAIKQFVV